MVITVEGSPVVCSKSRESNPMVCTVTYGNIFYERVTFVHLNSSFSWSSPCDLLVGGMCVNSIYVKTAMFKRTSVKVEKVAGKNPYWTTNTAWRRRLGTAKYPQPIEFEKLCKNLKGSILDCSGGFSTGKYQTSMKEVTDYIWHKFSYGSYIHQSLENETKTRNRNDKEL